MSVLSRAKVSGSLEYWGRCDNMLRFPDFPKLSAPRSNAGSPVELLSEMFADDPSMQVTQERDGTIRMVEIDVARDLLDLKIGHISFNVENETVDPHWLKDPRAILRFILAAPEVRAFMKAQNIGPPDGLWGIVDLYATDSPSISGALHDVTLSRALDYMLKTFPGLWVYENCASERRKRVVFFTFYSDTAGWADQARSGMPAVPRLR